MSDNLINKRAVLQWSSGAGRERGSKPAAIAVAVPPQPSSHTGRERERERDRRTLPVLTANSYANLPVSIALKNHSLFPSLIASPYCKQTIDRTTTLKI